jgi:hypothetical protein
MTMILGLIVGSSLSPVAGGVLGANIPKPWDILSKELIKYNLHFYM